MSEILNVNFYGPYALASDKYDILSDSNYADKSGIYIWTVKMKNGVYRIFYIGETKRSFYIRMKEHLVQQLCGKYIIYDPESFRRGIPKMVWEGLWGKERKNKLPDFLSRYAELAPINLEFIKCQSLFLAPLNIDKVLQKNIEGVIAKEVRKSSDASALLEEGVRYYNPTETKDDITVKIKAQEVIEGLPEEINL